MYVGTTLYDGHVAFRPAIVNWRTTSSDVDLLVEVIRELVLQFCPIARPRSWSERASKASHRGGTGLPLR